MQPLRPPVPLAAPPNRSVALLALGAGLVHSLLLFVAFSPVGFWPASLVAILPLVWIARRPGLRKRDLLLVFLGAVPYWAYTEWWIFDVSAPGYPGLVAIESAWPAVFVWLLWRTSGRLAWLPLSIAVPVLWTAVEFIRGELFANGYAWSLIAYPLIDAPWLAGFSTIGGVYAVGFLVAALAGAAADVLISRPRRAVPAAVAAVFAVLMFVVGAFVAAAPLSEQRRVHAAVVQTNVPQSNKLDWGIEQELADFDRFAELSRKAAGADPRPDLIVWPETMLPGLTLDPPAVSTLRAAGIFFSPAGNGGRRVYATHFYDELSALQTRLDVPMLVGEEAIEGLRLKEGEKGIAIEFDRRYNSVYMLNGGKVDPARYDKAKLTPFGETMPYISAWPWLEQQLLAIGAHGMKFDLATGTRLTVFPVPVPGAAPIRAVTPICFEVTVAPYCRRLVYGEGRRADLIVNVTNDGWFGTFDVAREQHLQIARWRSLELATPMVRAANTGISAVIDARGRVLRRGVEGGGEARTDGILAGELSLTPDGTIYGRFGDVVPWTALFLGVCMLISSWFIKPRGGEAPKDSA